MALPRQRAKQSFAIAFGEMMDRRWRYDVMLRIMMSLR